MKRELMNKPYVHSNYERIKNDDYQTIDKRCVQALLDCVIINGHVVDCCASHGSGIVNELAKLGVNVDGVNNAFSYYSANWIVTNPPYTRGLVDEILWHQIRRIETGTITGFATLMRSNFDFAKTRWDMFNNTHYAGQVKMMFRPWRSEDKKFSPIHNFVWHIWRNDKFFDSPVVLYWKENK
jgi:hypothetical protein